jgi:eukaryotic-like serine/threonine-protein kinase
VAVKLARFSWLPGALAAALVIAIGRLVVSTSSAPLELALYDRVARAQPAQPAPDIAIVSIDAASIAKLGEWPWARDVHASLLDRLRELGARIVAFTVPFDTSQRTSESERVRAALALLEASDLGNSPQARQLRSLLGESATGRDPNTHLARAMQAHGDVVLPIEVQPDHPGAADDLPAALFPHASAAALQDAIAVGVTQSPASLFADGASAIGHTYLQPDADGTVRTDLVGVRVGAALMPSLPTAIAARAFGIAPAKLSFEADGALHLASYRLPLEPTLVTRPHYFEPHGPKSFTQYPYWQVLAGDIPAGALRDKIVLIGFAGPDAASVATAATARIPAVVATASAVSGLMQGTNVTRPAVATALEWVAALGVILFAAFVLPAVGAGTGALATILIVVILLVTEIGLLSSADVWMRLVLPSGALIAGYGLYLASDLIRRSNGRTDYARETGGNLRALGQTFQKQGQLDLAFETYRRCPLDAPTLELLYHLGMDFERRAQLQKAAAVYTYIASRDPNYRDLRARRARVREEPLTRDTASLKPATPLVTTSRARDIDLDDTVENLEAPPLRAANTRTLGRYEIERELGKGAMGTVYLGRDPKINRVVAIKAIPLAEEFEESDLLEARARFFREAEMAGRLNHPAIVTVHDAGEDRGLAYIAMEYLRGQHLSYYADSGRLLPPQTVMLLIARVADALHYAHRENVVHRDIKPANIMFNPDTDELKITDFGIARLTDVSRTKTGIVLGTPSFMSPEQLEGRPIDGRSDQFALGVSLYQLLCGQLPFRAESMPRLMQKIAMEPHASVRLIRPELPACIDPIIERVLSKSADDRYANCAELAAALRACAGPQTQAQAQPSRREHEWLLP